MFWYLSKNTKISTLEKFFSSLRQIFVISVAPFVINPCASIDFPEELSNMTQERDPMR